MTVPTKALKFTPNEKMLTEDQTIKDCKGEHKVWVLDGNTFRAYPVKVGISNGMMTEVVGGLKPGQKIMTEFKMTGEEVLGNNGNNNPFMPRPRNRQQQQQKK